MRPNHAFRTFLKHALPSLVLPATCVLAVTTAQAQSALVPDAIARRSISEQVHFDRVEDRLWARGAAWKMSFDASGATYTPFLGSDAPRNFPIRMKLVDARSGGNVLTLDSAALPTRADNEVRFDRGDVIEAYAMQPREVEQLFYLDERPAAGELVLTIDVETDLLCAQRDGGLEFENAYGKVGYSRAIAIDAMGARLPLDTRVADGDIEIRVPAGYMATAAFPLVIDPVVSTFEVEAEIQSAFQPDVAYAVDGEVRWFIWEEIFSVADHDIVVQSFEEDGAPMGPQSFIDSTDADWRNVSIAYTRNPEQCLVVAEVGPLGDREVWGRSFDGFTLGILYPQFQISNVSSSESFAPRVGGSPDGSSGNFLVVWQRDLQNGARNDVFAQRVFGNNSLVGSNFVISAGITNDEATPDVSNADLDGVHNVVWERLDTGGDIFGARVDGTTAGVTGPFIVQATAGVQARPTVSESLGYRGQYLVAFQNGDDVRVVLMEGATPLVGWNASDANPLPSGQSRSTPDVASDGNRFLLTYSETINQFSEGAFATTFEAQNSSLAPEEVRVPLNAGASFNRDVRVSANGPSGGAGRYCAVWGNVGIAFAVSDIDAVIFETGSPDYDCCCAPNAISGEGYFPFDTLGATAHDAAGPGCPVDADVWFSWTAPAVGTYSFSTCGHATANTVLAAYAGDPCSLNAALDCDNDTCGLQSQILVPVNAAGTVYQVRVGTLGAGGNGLLEIRRASNFGTAYCNGLANSVSAGGANLTVQGSTSQAANNLLLMASPLPPNTPGRFYFGTTQVSVPFGDGLRCVGLPTYRLPIVFSSGGGTATFAVNNAVFPGTLLSAGFTWFFQYWYRDQLGGPGGFNLSDARALTFVP